MCWRDVYKRQGVAGMEIIVFLSIVIAVVAVLTSIVLVRRVKKQIAEMTDALAVSYTHLDVYKRQTESSA